MMKNRDCSFKPIVSPYNQQRPVDWGTQFQRDAPIDVEIGFGMGEVLIRSAHRSPDRNFVGIEQHWERIYKTLRNIERRQAIDQGSLKNIRILKTEARIVFERLIAPESIDSIYCLFPCPWPKKGHIKHRLFDRSFLKLLNNRLKKSGRLKIVTDFYPYYEWILDQSPRTGFEIRTETTQTQYDTKFERKWREEGQKEFFEINFFKKKHIMVPVKEEVNLKSYVLDHFDAQRLELNDQKGEVSIIFKGVLYDKEKQKAMIRALVAEENLTQHFWITVKKKEKQWRIARAEGQNFFPTPGIAKALALVYEAAAKTGN